MSNIFERRSLTGKRIVTQQLPIRIAGARRNPPQSMLSSAKIYTLLEWRQDETQSRDGIITRHVAAATETSSFMVAEATHQALKAAGLSSRDLDLILRACGVMEQSIPSTAVVLQDRLGPGRSPVPAYNVHATCLSSLKALDVAAMNIEAGHAQRPVVVEQARCSLRMGAERVVNIFVRTAMRIAVSISSALHHAVIRGLLKRGQIALMIGIPTGIPLGSAVVRY